MYKLILVDDEEEVRKGILKKINWNEYGFEISGEAENGREALEIAEKVVPDVVITDIKMPFMDGIKLAQKLRERFPSIEIVILTGFDEFEYAQKAIKLNVMEYVLKPISSNEMIDILMRVKSKIDDEIAKRKDIQALKEHYKRSLPILKEKFLASLVSQRISKNDIAEKSASYGLSISGKSFIVSVLSIDSNSVQLEEDQMETDSRVTDDEELLRFAVFNITEEFVSKFGLGISFIHYEHIVIISISMEDQGAIMDNTLFALEEIKKSVQKFLKVTVSIGVGDGCSDIASLGRSYKNAVNALDYRVILGHNRVICIGDFEPKRTHKAVFDELKEHSLVCALKVGTPEEIRGVIDNLFQEIIDAKSSYKDYQIYLIEMLTTILKVAKDLGEDTDDVFGNNYNIFIEMYKLNDIQEVKEWFTGICLNITGYISRERQDVCKLLVKRAKDYIQNNYFDSEMTIDKVCKYIHISPAYFSTIFKKETKLTFVNYLTNIRMQAAKELLRSTNLKTFQIAEKVGYSEPNYFSYCFKKNLNVSPSDYRNNLL